MWQSVFFFLSFVALFYLIGRERNGKPLFAATTVTVVAARPPVSSTAETVKNESSV